jgi:ParB family chromosome partitioning protein
MTPITSSQLTTFSGAAIGRMIPVDKVRPNPEQPRKALGDLHDLAESIREKGVLEPLLVRFIPREEVYYIISGERRYHAARAKPACASCLASRKA